MSARSPLVRELSPAPDPAATCAGLEGLPCRVFFDSAARDERLGRYSFVTADPAVVVRGRQAVVERRIGPQPFRRVDASAIELIRTMLASFRTDPVPGLPPFQGGAAGYLGYEFGQTLESLPPPRYDDLCLPDLVMGIYDWVLAWDHQEGRAWLVSTGIPEEDVTQRMRRAVARADQVLAWLTDGVIPAPTGAAWPEPPAPAPSWPVNEPRLGRVPGLRSSFTRDAYLDAVASVRDYIAAGDIFQANLSQRFELPLDGTPWAAYERLRARNAAPFAAYLDFPEATILSASPERFLRVAPDGQVETRPIKGTRPRGFGPEHDAHLGQELVESAKDQAENLMIVDLMRNDLSRVCRAGSVRAAELFALERYATVHHLVSTVTGRLAAGLDGLALLQAAFPGGSVTGAPKIRAMEILVELEPTARGVYCGSLGYVSLTGAMDTSIAIRTAVSRGGRMTFSAGGGITFDSDPAQEYRETLDKARGMIDTLAATNGAGARQS
jgi:para-aminobenzoate synthetase component 1